MDHKSESRSDMLLVFAGQCNESFRARLDTVLSAMQWDLLSCIKVVCRFQLLQVFLQTFATLMSVL